MIYIKNIDEKVTDMKDRTLPTIQEQTTQHNHRMSKSELWQAKAIGGFYVIMAILVPSLSWLFIQVIDLKVENQTRHSSIDQLSQQLDPNR